MRIRQPLLALALVLVIVGATGCTGAVRETTTARTSTEMLLLSTATERALSQFDPTRLKDKVVQIDDSHFDSVDKNYVLSALRNYIAENGARLQVKGAEGAPAPDYVLEIRSASLGIYDSTFGIGVPQLPLPIPQTNIVSASPPLHLLHRAKQEGWAKFQIWIRHPVFGTYIGKSKDLWGHSYQSVWFIFGIGPITCSNDIYPEDESVYEVMPEDHSVADQAD